MSGFFRNCAGIYGRKSSRGPAKAW